MATATLGAYSPGSYLNIQDPSAVGRYLTRELQNISSVLGLILQNLAFGITANALSNAAGQTLTVAQVINSVLTRSGAAAVSDTTPTAAGIIASLPPGCRNFTLDIINQNTGLLTLVAGTGVTLAGTTTVATVFTRHYCGIVTNPIVGSEAVKLQGVFTAAL